MGISFSGVNSGIDSDLIVKQMMAAASMPLFRLQQRQQEWNAKNSAIDRIEGILKSMQDHAASMDTIAELRATQAITSDNKIVTTKGSATAIEGSHTVVVNQLARAEREVQTTGVATLETVIYTPGDDIFTYTYNGTQRSVTIQEDNTLEDLVEAINSDDGNPGMGASVLQYNGAYHLVLAGHDTGSSATITVDTSPASIGAFTQTQTAQSSQVKVDGWPVGGGDWIERDTNALADVIPGVTLNLLSVSADPVTVTVSRNTFQVTKDVENFVAMYNGIAKLIKDLTKYDPETETSGVLQGDSIINGLMSEIRMEFMGHALGFDGSEDGYTIAAQLGIEIDDEGVMTLDKEVLADAMADDYIGVLSLLGANKTGRSSIDEISYVSGSDETKAGVYIVQMTFDVSDGSLVGGSFLSPGSATANLDVGIENGVMTGKFGFAEQGLTLLGVWDGQPEDGGTPGFHTQTATVHVRQGFVGRVLATVEAALDDQTGMVSTKKSHYSAQIDAIGRNIDRKMEWLDRLEKRFKAEYARMEAMLARLDSQKGAFEALIMQVDSLRKTAND